MSKPIHVSEELHKAVKMVATEREEPMKDIVEDLLRADEDIAAREEVEIKKSEGDSESEAEVIEA